MEKRREAAVAARDQHGARSASTLRVTMDWLEILDSMDVDTVGEFRFVFRVSTDRRGLLTETRYPEEGTIAISEDPSKNRVRIDLPLFEGSVEDGEALIIEAGGEESDRITRNDQLEGYHREFRGDASSWSGNYGPWDETTESASDPENLEHWRLGYRIETIPRS